MRNNPVVKKEKTKGKPFGFVFPRNILAAFFCVVVLLSSGVFSSCSAVATLDFLNEKQEVCNIVIPVVFDGGSDLPEDFSEKLNEKLFDEEIGLAAFFKAESLGKCAVDCVVLKPVYVAESEGYYRKYSILNKDGYNAKGSLGKENVDYFFREQMLIREIISLADIPANLVADRDGDGYADGITFVFNCEFETRGSTEQKIMWPHKSAFYPYGDSVEESFYTPENFYEEKEIQPETAYNVPSINGAAAYAYNIVSSGSSVGDMCHEFSHVLGLPDYYSYVSSEAAYADYIGGYELLGRRVGDIPQYSLAYVRSKLGWLSEGKEIHVVNSSETAELLPVTRGAGISAIKIIPPDFEEKREYFIIEAREKTDGAFDSSVESSGVIIYRVNEFNGHIDSSGKISSADYGNMYGNGNYEVTFITNPDPMLPVNYFTEKEGRNSVENLRFSDGSISAVSVKIEGKNDLGGYSISIACAETEERKQILPHIYKKGQSIAIEWTDDTPGKTVFAIIRADALSSAAFAMSVLPDAVRAANANGGEYTLLSAAVKDNRSGLYIPEIEEECYILSAKLGEDGKVTDKQVFHIRTSDKAAADFTYSDFLKVAFMRGNPAYIATWAIGTALLFTVLTIVLLKLNKKKKD